MGNNRVTTREMYELVDRKIGDVSQKIDDMRDDFVTTTECALRRENVENNVETRLDRKAKTIIVVLAGVVSTVVAVGTNIFGG